MCRTCSGFMKKFGKKLGKFGNSTSAAERKCHNINTRVSMVNTLAAFGVRTENYTTYMDKLQIMFRLF